MINKLSHTPIWVLDQDEALDFYTNKLGFEVKVDARAGDFRWLTVGPKGRDDLELILMEPKPGPMYDEESTAALRTLVEKGSLGAGVFQTDDCQKTYEELSARGVEFICEPTERPYGIEAIMKDNSGNWFSVTQAN